MTKDHRQDALKPCPFCDGGETRFDEKTYWTGQRSETLSWELRHWCNGSGLDSAMITVRGKTKEEVINRWNTRAYEAGKADANALPECQAEITDDWLGAIGFKWHQEERQPSKHWSLTLGWGAPNGFACMDDLCIEVASGAMDGNWFCWLRKGTRFSDKSVHVRHIRYQREIEDMITALTGTKFKKENCLFGNFYSDKIAEKMRRDYPAAQEAIKQIEKGA